MGVCVCVCVCVKDHFLFSDWFYNCFSLLSDSETWFCDCPRLYSGKQCQFATCESNPCRNGATCVPKSGTDIVCLCPYGRSGLLCVEGKSFSLLGMSTGRSGWRGEKVTQRNQGQYLTEQIRQILSLVLFKSVKTRPINEMDHWARISHTHWVIIKTVISFPWG